MKAPRTGARCSCRPGVQRDNCPSCEGTGWVLDFRALREQVKKAETPRCIDCGEEGVLTGHMECQYPGRFSDPDGRR